MTTPEHVKQSPKQKIKAPRAAAPAAACVAGRSRGQHMPPQQALKTNGNSAPPHKTKKTKRALILVASLQRRDGAEWTLLRPRAGGGLNSLNPKPQKQNPSCRHSVAACVSDHSCGQDLPPANPLRTNGNTALPIKLNLCRSQARSLGTTETTEKILARYFPQFPNPHYNSPK